MLRLATLATTIILVSLWPGNLPAQDIAGIAKSANAHLANKNYKGALNDLRELDAVYRQSYPDDFTSRAAINNRMAGCLTNLAEPQGAAAAYADALGLISRAAEPSPALEAAIRLNAARLHLDTFKDWQAAEQILTPALTATPTSDPKHIQTLTLARTTLGEIQRDSLRWNEAIETLETATADCAALPVPDDPGSARDLQLETARAHHSLGRLLLELGENTNALDHLQRANKIYFSNIREAGSPNRVNPRINLARAHIALDQFSVATDLLEYTLAELGTPNARQRPNNTELETRTLQALASANFESKNFSEAVRYNRMIIAPERTALVAPSETATALSNLAIAELLATGDTASASKNIERAFEIFATLPDSLDGFEHRFSAHFNRAMIRHHAGDAEGALADARAALAEVRKSFDEVFLYLSPQVRLAYSQKLVTYPFHLAGTLADPGFAAEIAIQIKNLVTDSVARDRARLGRLAGSTNAPDLATLQELERDFATLSLRNGDTTKLRSEIHSLRASLLGDQAASFATLDAPPSLSEVQAALADGETAIDFFSFRNNRAEAGWSWDIGAVVLRNGIAPQFYKIPENRIDELRTLLDDLDTRIRLIDESPSSALKGNPDRWCKDAYEIILGHPHAQAALARSSTLTLSLDGILHAVPFAALRDSTSTPLISSHAIRQVGSLRHLLTAPPEIPEQKLGSKALLVANPKFLGPSAAPTAPNASLPLLTVNGRSLSRSLRSVLSVVARTGSGEPAPDWQERALVPLPGTENEVQRIATLLGQAGYDPETQIGDQPTEIEVRNALEKASLIHLATHGFFIPAAGEDGSTAGRAPLDAMVRGGLTLVGAEHTIQAWQEQQVPDTTNDGILLASEIASLDLSKTHLVVLSACDTSRGDAANGQGVIGLRSALTQAGCPNTITTLWPIDDEKTVTLMEDFYTGYLGGNPPHTAMASAQRSFLKANKNANPWRTLFYSSPFVVTATGSLR